MRQIKLILLLAMSIVTMAAWGETVDGVIITSGDSQQQFAINSIKEITFSDSGMTVVTTDNASVTFTGEWQLKFGEVDQSGVIMPEIDIKNGKAKVFNPEGKLVKEYNSLSEVKINELPAGVYIILCNGKSLKIKR